MAHDVFISYASEDKKIADAVCHVLEENGIRCWIAPRDTGIGSYGESIIKAISESKIMVVVISKNSIESPHVENEVVNAVNKGVIIIPIRIENIVPTGTLQFHLAKFHWLDAFPPPVEKYFAKLVDQVKKNIEEKPSERNIPSSHLIRSAFLLGVSLAKRSWFYGKKEEIRYISLETSIREAASQLGLNSELIDRILSQFMDEIDEKLTNSIKGSAAEIAIFDILKVKYDPSIPAFFRFGFNIVYLTYLLTTYEVLEEQGVSSSLLNNVKKPASELLNRIKKDAESLLKKTGQSQILKEITKSSIDWPTKKLIEFLKKITDEIEEKLKSLT
ncbi:MAG: toll/interleukin-1 receptor domain-containing protein [candidate division WOR-3 bacterium]